MTPSEEHDQHGPPLDQASEDWDDYVNENAADALDDLADTDDVEANWDELEELESGEFDY